MDRLGDGMKDFLRLCALAFAGSIGITFIFLACALPQYNVWYPMLVVLFYLFVPLPLIIACRISRWTYRSGSTNAAYDWAIFFTMFFVVSSFGLPVVLARCPWYNPKIQWGACYLTMAGNVVIFGTLIAFAIYLYKESDYGSW